ncbi:MAG: VOC family protein [Thermomicrobiales bacterium]
MITDLGHVALAVHDLEASLAFYQTLGVEEAFRLNREDGSLMLAYLHVAGDRFIELFPGGPEPAADRTHSFRHICLLTDDLHGDVERLRARGIAIEREPTEGLDTNLQAWIRDPDGNAIELMQIAETSPQWQKAHSA